MKARFLILTTVALAAAPFLPAQVTTFYRSNPLGLRLEQVGNASDHPYVLEVTREGTTDVEVLRDATQTVRTTTRRFSAGTVVQETVTESGEVTVRRDYDNNGRLLLERDLTSGRRYRYLTGRLIEMEVTDHNGVLLYKEGYSYTWAGRLREAIKTLADGGRTIVLYNFAEGRLVEEMVQDSDRVILNRYSPAGLLTHRERRDTNGELLTKTVFGYATDGGVIRSSRHEDYLEGTVRDRVFDVSGRLIFEDQTGADAYTMRFGYDSQGHKMSESKTGAKGLEEWSFEYDLDGKLITEKYYLRGALQRTTTHTGEREWHEDLYRGGRAVLRVYYQNDEKTAEEPL